MEWNEMEMEMQRIECTSSTQQTRCRVVQVEIRREL